MKNPIIRDGRYSHLTLAVGGYASAVACLAMVVVFRPGVFDTIVFGLLAVVYAVIAIGFTIEHRREKRESEDHTP